MSSIRNVSQHISSVLSQQNMTQQELADKSKVSQATINQIVKGGKNIRLATLDKIADALKISPSQLIDC